MRTFRFRDQSCPPAWNTQGPAEVARADRMAGVPEVKAARPCGNFRRSEEL
jgi:hypothetical protein